MRINYKKLNPVGFHLLELLPDPTIRQIILYGGSSSSKSYSVAQCFLIMIMREGQSMLVMRKVGASIRDSIYKSFRRAAEQLGITHYFQFKDGVKIIKCLLNDAEIIFKGLDDSEKIKGLESIKRVFMDEWSEYEEDDYKQMKLRLRGMEGQQLIFAFNPIKETHWIKKNVFDKEVWHDVPMTVTLGGMTLPPQLTEVKSIRMNAPKSFMHKRTGELITHPSDMIAIQSTYLNNFWVVGSPDGTYGYYDEQCIANFENERLNDPDYYNVYALGEWGVIRTGSEFFGSFNRGIHCTECKYNPELPIHVSVDNNVLPYISYSFWQIDYTNGKTIYQIDELPAESPNNTARKSALLVAKKLKALGVYKIFLHGDASTRNASTIDDQKRSFLDLVIDTLQKEGIEVVDCVGNKNPSVPMSGEFINTIFEKKLPGLTIFISEQCKTAIEDYMSVQKDENGGMLKTRVKNKTTGQSYEEHGHISDTFRYVVCDLLKEEFFAFSNRRKRNLYAKDGAIHFYNPDTECKYTADIVYCMPNINSKFVLVYAKKCGERWHITHIRFLETTSTDEMKQALEHCNSGQVVLECPKSYYLMARELRDGLSGDVRVVHESGDMARRIAAMSDYVKNNILFNEQALNEDLEYSAYMTNLLDYNKDSGENIEASAVLSGLVQTVVKLGL